MNETLFASRLKDAQVLSVAQRVRNYLGEKPEGTLFTSRSIADAIGPSDNPASLSSNVSAALFKARDAGYVEVVETNPTTRMITYKLTKAKDWETRPGKAAPAAKPADAFDVKFVDEKVHAHLKTLPLRSTFTPLTIGEKMGWIKSEEVVAIGRCLDRGRNLGFLKALNFSGRFVTYELINEVGMSAQEAAEAVFKTVPQPAPVAPPTALQVVESYASDMVMAPTQPVAAPEPVLHVVAEQPQPVLAEQPGPIVPAPSLMTIETPKGSATSLLHERLLDLAAEMETIRTNLAQYSDAELIAELHNRHVKAA